MLAAVEGPQSRVRLRTRSAPAAANASLERLAALAKDKETAAAITAVVVDVSDSKAAEVPVRVAAALAQMPALADVSLVADRCPVAHLRDLAKALGSLPRLSRVPASLAATCIPPPLCSHRCVTSSV